jgi:protein-S-isoprenylcysteine O-methyltransferase Ste14
VSTLVIVFRTVALLAFAGPMLLGVGARRRAPKARTRRRGGGRAPVVANFAAFGLFFPSLIIFSGSANSFTALLLALLGSLVAVVGAALVLRSRAELGPAWSFLPKAGEETDLVTTGPYRLVRHPIYLGLTLVAVGQALAFSSWPAFLIVLSGIVPTFAWRARTEETLLSRTFGRRYALYQKQTKMIIPYLSLDPTDQAVAGEVPWVRQVCPSVPEPVEEALAKALPAAERLSGRIGRTAVVLP